MKSRKKGLTMNFEGKEVLNTQEVGILLQLQTQAIYNGIRNGLIPAQKIGNRWRYSKTAIVESLNVKK